MSSSSPVSDLSHRLHRVAAFTALALTIAAGCDSCCAEDPVGSLGGPVDAPVCVVQECEDGDAFRYGVCDGSGCADDSDCCPGTRCRTDINSCFPRLLDNEFECETSADCPDPAHVCATISIGGRDPLPTCIFESCGGDSDCGDGRACYAGFCLTNAPCGGSCPEGTVCDISTNSCHLLPTRDIEAASGAKGVNKNCNQECPDGLIILEDAAAMSGEICCEVSCVCETLPPIVPTRLGHYTRVAVGTQVLVSAYDAEFGDLAVIRFDLDGNKVGNVEYVDGFPIGEAPSADPSGPRRGIRGPGTNVGTHTAIALDANGLGRIAYHDVDNNALKVAIEGPTPGTWASHFVDGGSAGIGQIGTFNDIAVLPNGSLLVTYLAHDALHTGVAGQATGLKLARSTTPLPGSAADWELFTVDARAHVVDPAARPEAKEMPRARGLHSQIVLDGADAVIAYYDHGDGDVRVARFSGSSAVVSVVDGDGNGGRLGGDVGRHAAVGITDGDLLVAYEDSTRHNLRYWKGPLATPGEGGAYGIADQLREAARSGSHFVGGGARMSVEGSKPVLVHQDASTLDLRFATFDGTAWTPTTVLDAGANGFYSDVAVSAGKAFVVSVIAELDSRGKERSRVRLDVQQVN